MGIRRGSITTRIITDGLVLNLDAANRASYPKVGTIWNDTINGNNGTLTNGPTFDSDNKGSIVFDGVNDYVIGNALNSGGGSGTSQSYSIWFNATTTSGFIGLFFWAIYEGIGISDGEIYIQTQGDNSRGDFSPTPTTATNTWCNAVFNFNQGISYECWINGISYGTGITSDTSPAPSLDYLVGAGYASGISRFFTGKISNILCYNRALSSSEVLHNYNALKGRFGL